MSWKASDLPKPPQPSELEQSVAGLDRLTPGVGFDLSADLEDDDLDVADEPAAEQVAGPEPWDVPIPGVWG